MSKYFDIENAVLIALVTLVGFLIFIRIRDASSPTLTKLSRADWYCSASHQETATTIMLVDKVMIPMTTTSTVCDAYARKVQS